MRVRVKICGIGRVEDAECAAAQGADAIGMVLWPRSPRAVELAAARRVADAVAPFVTVVTLFVNPTRDEVLRAIDTVRPHLLQFHGDESEDFCTGFGMPYLKAVKLRDAETARAELARHPAARALLLDSHDPVRVGGTGRSFDWRMIPARHERALILAGGLDAGNVGRAIADVRPFAVDVSTGVEQSPGHKDHARIAAFMQAVAAANQALAQAGTRHEVE